MKIDSERLKKLVQRIFAAAGCQDAEAARVAHYLVEANLVGHDSHGVIRVLSYVDFIKSGRVVANQNIKIVRENEVLAVVDGQFGLGQTIGEQAMQLGIDKSSKHGVAVIALQNAGHLGRIGDWPLMAARAGKISLHWVNTSGAGILVAPFGGISRRLSANPIAAAVPMRSGSPILLDISACTLAEGKIRVALNKGVKVPDGCIIDATGQPTNDPKVFYGGEGVSPGAILSIAGHKGYGLGIITEILAGALTGSSCSDPKHAGRLANGMLAILLDPLFFESADAFYGEIERFVAYVKSAEKVSPDAEILMPGDIEERTKAQRVKEGIELDDTTLKQLADTARSLGINDAAAALA